MKLVTRNYVMTGGSGGHVINITITSQRANSWLSITFVYFTHPRDKQAACPTPYRCFLIIVKHYRVAGSNSWLEQTNGDCVHVFLRTLVIISVLYDGRLLCITHTANPRKGVHKLFIM